MNISLETAVELESVILYIDNGEDIELCDSTKLNKSAKIWHVYGIGDICKVRWSEEERLHFVETVSRIMPVEEYLELHRKKGNPIHPYRYLLDENSKYEFDSDKIKVYEELNHMADENNRYCLIDNEIVQIKIAGAEAYIQNVDSRVEEYIVINIDKMVEDIQVVANRKFIGCILKESLNLKSVHMQYVITVVTGKDAPSINAAETICLHECKDLNLTTSSIDGVMWLTDCSKLNILANNNLYKKSQSYSGKTIYIKGCNSIKADLDFDKSCSLSRVSISDSNGIKIRAKNIYELDIDSTRKRTGAYAEIHLENVEKVSVDNDNNCEITVVTKKAKASMPDKFRYKLSIDNDGNITWENENEAAGNARISISNIGESSQEVEQTKKKTVVYAGVAIMNGNKEPDPNEEKEVHAAIKIGGKKDGDKKHVSMAQRFKEKFKL